MMKVCTLIIASTKISSKTILQEEYEIENPNQAFCNEVINEIVVYFQRNPDSNLSAFLKRSGISLLDPGETTFSLSTESFNVPLIHPLRHKGEPLRPVTVLGGLGATHFVRQMLEIHSHCRTDVISIEMTEQTSFFRQHFENFRVTSQQVDDEQALKSSLSSNSPGKSSGISSFVDLDNSMFSFNNSSTGESSYSEIKDDVKNTLKKISILPQDHPHLRKKELLLIIEKLHVPSPVIPDNKSGSYHTVSEEDSDSNIPSHTDTGLDELGTSSILESTLDQGSVTAAQLDRGETDGQDKWQGLKSNTLTSFNSDDFNMKHDTSEEIVIKEPWWEYASKKIVRGVPGYGLANFFRRYHEAAHHILYSILLGRPIVICGEEKLSRKVGRIITALVPLVPISPSTDLDKTTQETWRLLRWHRGILVQAHIEAFKLIGLCIPEKLEVHDLIPPRLVNLVTILSVEKREILGGPAYCGQMLQNFEKKIQKHFYNADISILSYIGGVYAEIEAKVYMFKVMEDKYKKRKNDAFNNIHLLFKELNIRASDIEIVKYIGSLISDPSECVNIL